MPHNTPHTYATIRTVLISYGVLAAGYLSGNALPDNGAHAVITGIHAPGLVLLGLALQLLIVAARLLVKRYATDPDVTLQGMLILELLGDGATVLLFALGTLAGILQSVGNL